MGDTIFRKNANKLVGIIEDFVCCFYRLSFVQERDFNIEKFQSEVYDKCTISYLILRTFPKKRNSTPIQ